MHLFVYIWPYLALHGKVTACTLVTLMLIGTLSNFPDSVGEPAYNVLRQSFILQTAVRLTGQLAQLELARFGMAHSVAGNARVSSERVRVSVRKHEGAARTPVLLHGAVVPKPGELRDGRHSWGLASQYDVAGGVVLFHNCTLRTVCENKQQEHECICSTSTPATVSCISW